jgi:1-deoxy-D-xylulose-5-phosphate synthase
VLQLGLRDEFIEHGDPHQLLALQGLDAPGIQAAIARRFGIVQSERPSLKAVA